MTTRSPLINALREAARLTLPSQFQIAGCGSVSIYPQQHCYVTDIQNWDVAYQSRREQIAIKGSLWGVPPSGALPLAELQWRVAYHEAHVSRTSPVDSNDLIRLQSWPNLTRLPADLVAPVTQICALLWRKPSVAFLIPRVLESEPDSVFMMLDVLRDFGHVKISRGASGPVQTAVTDVAQDLPAKLQAQSSGSVVGKLWRKLVGQQ